MDVSPNCDCWSNNDMPIIPNLGIAASFDPVALDKACADMVNNAPMLHGCALESVEHVHVDGEFDKFTSLYHKTDWRATLKHGEEIGLGSLEYELIKV